MRVQGARQEPLKKIVKINDLSAFDIVRPIGDAKISDFDLPAVIRAIDIKQAGFVGNEGNGVSQKILEACEHRITIPMYGNIESLNVSIASALCLYKVRESWSK